MQREIEALLAAYLEDRQKEAKLVQEILTALSVAAASRQRMFDAIATAVQPLQERPAEQPDIATLRIAEDLSVSLGSLRKAFDAAITH
jgi:AcrR family transcriptional regulator